jgi:hypothetical protein
LVRWESVRWEVVPESERAEQRAERLVRQVPLELEVTLVEVLVPERVRVRAESGLSEYLILKGDRGDQGVECLRTLVPAV